MYKDILTKEQKEILPIINTFSKDYYLVGGTAIALHIGHRRSIDFDLFTSNNIKRKAIKNTIESAGYDTRDIIYEAFDQMHIIINGVKVTFFNYPYKITTDYKFEKIKMPSLLDLAAMKVYALGGRAKWKDYVDIYFILKYHHSFNEIVMKAKEVYNNFVNDKLFKEQLSYFDDVDYSEEVEFIGEEIPKEEIQKFLIDIATEKF